MKQPLLQPNFFFKDASSKKDKEFGQLSFLLDNKNIEIGPNINTANIRQAISTGKLN